MSAQPKVDSHFNENDERFFPKTIAAYKSKFEQDSNSVLTSLQAVEKTIDDNKSINAFITRTSEIARSQAELSEYRYGSGKQRKLEGIPIAVKDNFCTKNILTTAGSKILENFTPTYESSVTQKLWSEGAVLLGKTNMDEFGMGSATNFSAYGPTLNPFALKLGLENIVPGGSSGGSAAAVSAGFCMAAIGTDTGGSIRQPASFCGVVGMKPTYGLCSRWGIIAYASSLDQAGVIANSVDDVVEILNVITGPDEKDTTSYNGVYPDFGSNLHDGIAEKTIGIPKEFFEHGETQETKIVLSELKDRANAAGAKIEFISLPSIKYALPVYYIIALSEASSNLARYDGVRYGFRAKDCSTIEEMYENTRSQGFGEEVQRRIMLGTYCLSAGHYDQYYQRACKIRNLIKKEFENAFQTVDILAWPTTPTSAFSSSDHEKSNPLSMYLEDVFTVPVNLAGLPAISIPITHCNKGLPLGLTVCGNSYEDSAVIQFANNLLNCK